MDRFIKIILSSLLCLVFTSIACVHSYAINSGFELESISEEDKQSFLSYIDIKVFTEEPYKKAIKCFDVNHFGTVAVGQFDDDTIKTICVYNKDGTFLYGYNFKSSGSYGIQWDNDNIIIYFVRGDMAISITPDGEIADVKKITNSIENNYYWNNVVFSESRNIDGTEYKIMNDMGFFNVFSISYSLLVVLPSNGEKIVFYDVGKAQLLTTVTVFLGIIILVCSAVVVLIRQTKKNIKTHIESTDSSLVFK